MNEFEAQVAPFRRELLAHCYRMTGALSDAEDALQNTLVRAWRGLADFEGRSSLRTWLYRIATNACLNLLAERRARSLPHLAGPSGAPDAPVVPEREPIWLEPFPDALLEDDPDSRPDAVYARREATRLAFVAAPHPILLDEIDDLRQMAVEVGVTQGLSQLFRETFAVPKTPPEDPMRIDSYAGGEFAMMSQAIGLAKRLGYRVTGGASACRVLERGRFVDARYDLGDGDPMYETTTGDLAWVDDKQRPIAVVDVPPVAFSEGMRMAAAIYAKRKVEKEQADD